jgi:hypothetical protein
MYPTLRARWTQDRVTNSHRERDGLFAERSAKERHGHWISRICDGERNLISNTGLRFIRGWTVHTTDRYRNHVRLRLEHVRAAADRPGDDLIAIRREDRSKGNAFLGGIPHTDVSDKDTPDIHGSGQQDQHEGQAECDLEQALAFFKFIVIVCPNFLVHLFIRSSYVALGEDHL